MILILTSHGDHSSDQVIDWLNYYKADYHRINDDDIFTSQSINLSIKKDKVLFQLNEDINLNSFSVAWFRKFGLFRDSNTYKKANKLLNGELYDFFYGEFDAFLKAVYETLSITIKWVCDPIAVLNLSKIKQLIFAKNVGLDIPSTLITNHRSFLKKFLYNDKTSILIKPLSESEVFNYKKSLFFLSPRLISIFNFKTFRHERFFPSLMQEYLDKDIELRIFYLDGICYSMAIFSQLDEKTKIDFRHYNYLKPNRTIPYLLPKEISIKIELFMNSVGLNTGSIDMIKTKDGRYVFLEVNPKGQFGMVSYPCNYYLEEQIALSLINKSH